MQIIAFLYPENNIPTLAAIFVYNSEYILHAQLELFPGALYYVM